LKKLPIVILIFFTIPVFSQDYNWWNQKHNWDGITHWSNYMIVSPAFLGPNALPVPETNDGSLPGKASLELSVEEHYSKGDDTKDIFTKLYLPLFSDRVGLNLSMVPVEFYKMDTLTRDRRIVRDYKPEGHSFGDVYVGTFIQLVKNRKYLPDIMISANIRTASGGNLSAARFTDSPGYFFDASFGKDFLFNNPHLKSIRPFALLGFYVWQTNREDYFQDDAILYGAGFNLQFQKMDIVNSLGGYNGYIGFGDKPMVYTFTLKSKNESLFNYKIVFQQGIRDYMYTTIKVGCEIDLNTLKQRIIR
jgi:hypothetical protein